MKIGRKIYYDKGDGNSIVDTGERSGSVLPRTIEQDIATYTALSERNRDSFDVLELEYGQYAQDFAECNGYRVNPETKELEFSYPDLSETTTETKYQEPLSNQIEKLKQDNLELQKKQDLMQSALDEMIFGL